MQCLLWQYVHGLCAQLAYVHHRPQQSPLYDMGFNLFPEIGPDLFWVSEVSAAGNYFVLVSNTGLRIRIMLSLPVARTRHMHDNRASTCVAGKARCFCTMSTAPVNNVNID